MDFRRLEAFSNVYELNSFSRAAEKLHLSQPTISAHIATLERELKAPLFDRLGRSIMPTAAGDVLYTHALQAFEAIEKAKAEIQLLQDKVAGELVIGGSTIPAHYLLPTIMAGFMDQYPDVSLRLRVGDSESIAQDVAEGKLAVGVVGSKTEQPDVTFTPLMEDTLVVIAPRSMAKAGETVTKQRLMEMQWIMREQGSGTRAAFEKALSSARIEAKRMRVALTVESTQAAMQCVSAGLGVSITSSLAAASYIERGELVQLQTPDLNLSRTIYAVHHAKRNSFPSLRFFLDHLRQKTSTLAN